MCSEPELLVLINAVASFSVTTSQLEQKKENEKLDFQFSTLQSNLLRATTKDSILSLFNV